jgi:hypothetical protein
VLAARRPSGRRSRGSVDHRPGSTKIDHDRAFIDAPQRLDAEPAGLRGVIDRGVQPGDRPQILGRSRGRS